MSETDSPPKIAIIGGGITGLAAALTIRQERPDAEIAIFEASSHLGGSLRTRTEEVQLRNGSSGSFLVEQGADSFLIDDPATLRFFAQFGLAESLIPTNAQHRRAFVLHKGQLTPTPEHFALLQPRKLRALMFSRLLSPAARIRAAWELFIRKRTEEGEESLASFARRRFGRQVYDRLVEPLVAGIFTADGEKLSLQAALPRFSDMEQEHGSLIRAAWHSRKQQASATTDVGDQPSGEQNTLGSGARYGKFVTPRHGYSALIADLTGHLTEGVVRLNCRVEGLRRKDAGWKLSWRTTAESTASSSESEFNAVVLATPSPVASRLLSDVDADISQTLAKIEAASSVVVSFGFERDDIAHPLDGFGFVVPRIANRQLLAGSFPSIKFPGRAPDGCVLIRTFLGGALRPDVVEYLDNRVREIALAELGEILSIKGAPLFTHIARWRKAMPQYHLGHVELVRTIENRASQLPGFGLSGNYLHGVGIPHCLRSGQQAAQAVIAALDSR